MPRDDAWADNPRAFWTQGGRFEEITDSDGDDDDDERGVPLDGAFYGNESQVGSRYTGRYPEGRRKRQGYSRESDSSGDEAQGDGARRAENMQIALRDKEEVWLQSALARIQRAQMLGEKNVKLSPPEIQALERNRQRGTAPARSRQGSDREEVRQSNKKSTGAKGASKNKRKSQSSLRNFDLAETSSNPRRGTPPGILVPGPSGTQIYQPFDSHLQARTPTSPGSRGFRASGSSSRSASSHVRQPPYASPPSPSIIQFTGDARPPPLPSSTRRLPDDPNWIPRPRSSSSIASSAPAYEPYQYPPNSPPLPQIPPQYLQASGRRAVSNPQWSQPSRYEEPLPPRQQYHRVSEPGRTEYDARHFPLTPSSSGEGTTSSRSGDENGDDGSSDDDDDDDEDRDSDHGVQVNIDSAASRYPRGPGSGRREEGMRERPRRPGR